ncbi:ATP-binding protein [Candidatus Pacearchaeota archaeon]|nr:MAG: ATP-binding protein [Candidatus Pacearchaeota archaeon]
MRLKRRGGKTRAILLSLIRVFLVFTFFLGVYQNRKLVMLFSILGLAATFAPRALESLFNIRIPAQTELLVLLFVYGILIWSDARGYFSSVWWWDISLNIITAIALGFVGLTFLYVLSKEGIINASPLVISVLAFCFSLSVGTAWEVLEFALDSIFGFALQRGLQDTMKDLLSNLAGSAIVAVSGYFYMRSGKDGFVSRAIARLVSRNRSLFTSKEYLEEESEKILRLIAKGETEKTEFKSTLRMNLHTNQFDKNIEHSVLKTIVGYLNSSGGTLLVGVNDKGKVIGLEKDGFPDNDRLRLYLTNILKKHIGAEFLPFIKFELYPVHDKHVLKIDCAESEKPVFLKWNSEEEFYARHGPSTIKLSGSKLLDYINHRFG